jgi:hypothetical protein
MDSNKSLVLSIVGKDETKQAFDSVNKSLGVTEKQAKSFGETMGGIGKSLSSFGKTMSLSVTAPIVAIGGFALQAGAELDTLRGSYGRMTKSMGIDADEMLAVMKKTSQGTISENKLLLAANKAMSLGVVKNTDEMATIMEIARVKGQTMGLSMEQAFGDLVTGLGRGSAMILDNLGITVKVGEVNEQYAASIGKVASELTAEEQKMALVNAVVSQGKTELANMGEVALTNQEKLAQMTTKLTDMKAEIGTQLLPYAVKLAETLSVWIERFTNLDSGIKTIIFVIAGFLAILGPLALIISSLITVGTAFGVVIGFLATPIGLIAAAIAGVIIVGILLYKNWDTVKWAAGELWKFLTKTWGDGTDWLKKQIDKLIAWFDDLIEKIKSAIDWIKKYSGYDAISGAVSNVFGGGKAAGGFVSAGTSYIVGEKGPEMFSPSRNGYITPNNKMAGGGGINITITGNTLLDSRAGEKIGDLIIKRLKLSNSL